MKTPHQHRIEHFMMKAKQDLPKHPIVPNESVRKLRAKLILEEALETITALGFDIKLDMRAIEEGEGFQLVPSEEGPKLVDIVDGCADVSVVTIGTLSACGVKDTPILEAVDQNNLDKFGPGHKLRSDGKLVKPVNHKPPDILGLLKQQMYVG